MAIASSGIFATIGADLLYRALQVYRFAGVDKNRPYLECVKLVIEKNLFRTIATDSKALAIFEAPTFTENTFFEVFIPLNAAKDLCAALKKRRTEEVSIQKSGDTTSFLLPSVTQRVQHYSVFDDYPSWEPLIPERAEQAAPEIVIAILQLARVSEYLKAVFEPKVNPPKVARMQIGGNALVPLVFEVEGRDELIGCKAKIVQMLCRI
jgi:DNA polymerase III sliding clamp (beta) subunit (PCNA family)